MPLPRTESSLQSAFAGRSNSLSSAAPFCGGNVVASRARASNSLKRFTTHEGGLVKQIKWNFRVNAIVAFFEAGYVTLRGFRAIEVSLQVIWGSSKQKGVEGTFGWLQAPGA